MPGLIEWRRDDRGNPYPVYPRRPLNLPRARKLFGQCVTAACVTFLAAIFLGFYIFAAYTYIMGDWVFQCKTEKGSISVLFFFLGTLLPFLIGVHKIIDTYESCFLTQIVNCGIRKFNWMYFSLAPCFIPMLLSLYSSCHILPLSFKLVTFGLCSVLSIFLVVPWHYAQRHCKCKKCLGIKEVKLHYETMDTHVDELTRFNETDLINWFNMASSTHSQLAIQLENGEIIHTFTRNHSKIQLQPGNYFIRVLELTPVNVCPLPTTSKKACEPAATPEDHLIPKRSEMIKKDKTIMNID